MDRLAVSIRPYQPHDCPEMIRLFRDTVCTVNAADYTRPQIDAWIGGENGPDRTAWDRSFRAHYTLVAVLGEQIVGFGDMDASGYLDRLYVHSAYQRLVSLPPCAICWKHRLRRQRSLRMRRSRQGLFLKDAATVSSGPSRSNAMAFCSQTS